MIVWLSSFPRSGNTFLRALLKSCFEQDTHSIYNDNDIGGDPGLTDITGHQPLEFPYGSPKFDITHLRESEDPVFLKTHEPTRNLVANGDKIIYIVRDGREATLSFQRYLHNFHGTDVSWLDLQLGLEFPRASWADHVAAWAPTSHDDTLLIVFEDLICEPRNAVDRVSEFVGAPVLKYAFPTFDELQITNPKFFRRGRVDSYRQKLSVTEQTSFLLSGGRELLEMGYDAVPPAQLNQVSTRALLSFENAWREGVARLKERFHLSERASDELRRHIGGKDERIKALQNRISGLDREVSGLQNTVKTKDLEIAGLNEVSLRKDENISNFEIELAHSQRQLESSRNEFSAIQQTLSWKLTRPLRFVRRLFPSR